MSNQSHEAGHSDLHFLRGRHGELFESLGRITGRAADIMAVRALTTVARSSDIRSDRDRAVKRSLECRTYAEGPIDAEESLKDWNGDRVPLPVGAFAIAASLDGAPVLTPDSQDLPGVFRHTAGSNAKSYLEDPKHEPFLDIATGRFSHFYAAESRVELPNSNRLHIRVPIGEYGPNAAIDLMQATYKTMEGPTDTQLAQLHELADQGANRELILNHTTYGRSHRANYFDEKGDTPLGMALARTVHEGDLSVQQVVTLLTAQRVPGFKTMGSLWQAVREAKLVEKMTSLLPFGNLAPANDMNLFIPDLVVPTGSDSGVGLNSDIEKRLRQYKAATRADLVAFHKQNPEASAGNDMGIMCPALLRGAGLTRRHDVLHARYIGQYPRPRGIRRFV